VVRAEDRLVTASEALDLARVSNVHAMSLALRVERIPPCDPEQAACVAGGRDVAYALAAAYVSIAKDALRSRERRTLITPKILFVLNGGAAGACLLIAFVDVLDGRWGLAALSVALSAVNAALAWRHLRALETGAIL
jgi:hypothetical protein